MCEKINIAGLVNDSITDGPGLRFAVFVQGCPHGCEGCHNPQTHAFEGGSWMSVDEIFLQIKSNPLLDGVTFSGGEPMCQAKRLLPLAEKVKQLGLHVALYSGFKWEEMQTDEDMLILLKFVDVVIDGKFDKNLKRFDLRFRGSENQRILDVKKSLEESKAILVSEISWIGE